MQTEHEFMAVANFFSDEERSSLVLAGEAVSATYWFIGDLVLAKIAKAKEVHGEYPGVLMSIYDYVGGLVGKSRRSIQYYAEVARFFPDLELREAYSPLRFDTFKVAMSYGPRWRDVLDAALRYVDTHGGRLPTREWLEHFFRVDSLAVGQADAEEIPSAVEGEALEEVILWGSDKTVHEESGPTGRGGQYAARPVGPAALETLARVVDRFLAVPVQLPEEKRARLEVALRRLADVLAEIGTSNEVHNNPE